MNTSCSWPSPTTHPELCATEVHLWFADLCQPGEVIRALAGVLSADEQAQADRFCFERDRRRYIISRGLLRQMLGQYLALDGRDLVFHYGEWGKPALPEWQNKEGLQFNLSHSAEGVVYGIGKGRRIGVDMEFVRAIPEADAIADRFFPPAARRNYHSNNAGRGEETFLKYWTGREAFLKALGQGLAGADPASAPIEIDIQARQSSDRQNGRPPCGWFLHHFSPTHDYIGAVAVEADQCDLKYYCASPRYATSGTGPGHAGPTPVGQKTALARAPVTSAGK